MHAARSISLDTGNGREILAICHGKAYGMVFLPRNPSMGIGRFQAVVGYDCLLKVEESLRKSLDSRLEVRSDLASATFSRLDFR